MNRIIIVLLIMSCFFSCASKEKEIKADDSGASIEGSEAITRANNTFALEMYSELRKENTDDNVFFSPFSILVALTMTYEGAKGETAEEMEAVLHVPEDASVRRPNFARIYNAINEVDKGYELSTANALWAHRDFKFLKEYVNSIEKYYGGKVTNLDFAGAPENARQTINSWVADHTNQKIKDLIPPGVINDATRLVLTNAIYFKGIWLVQFDENDTQEEDFRTSAEDIVKVPMMRLVDNDARFKYAETDELQFLELPYEGDDLAMYIILPKKNDLSDIEKSMDHDTISAWKDMLRERKVHIYIPKFKFTTKYFLRKTLSDIGMPTAFGSNADFSGMNGTRDLFIQNVIHQAFVEVNEEGTEAAAATGVVMELTAIRPETPVFRADHPFIFFIQEIETGNILFMGRVCDPSK
jgi:serpin B